MKKSSQINLLILWGVLSFAAVALGFLWAKFDADSELASWLRFWGFFSSLIFVAYLSKPSSRPYGLIVFAFSSLMVVGIFFKILHLLGGDVIILVCLAGIVTTYAVMWFRERKTS